MAMKLISLVLLLLGVLLLVFGILAADSVASSFSRFFTGNPTDNTVFLIVAGAVALGAGVVMSVLPRRS